MLIDISPELLAAMRVVENIAEIRCQEEEDACTLIREFLDVECKRANQDA